MGVIDTILGTFLMGYLSLFISTFLITSSRTWISAGLFAVELLWAFQYYKYYSYNDSNWVKLLVSLALGANFVSLLGAFACIYLVRMLTSD